MTSLGDATGSAPERDGAATFRETFWAYFECPRDIQGGSEAHRRLGLVHRLRKSDRRHACEDITNPETSTTHRRSVALEDTSADQSPPSLERDELREQVAAGSLRERLAEAITAAIRVQKVRQRDLALAVGITEKHLSQMLTGKADGALPMWDRLAAQLGGWDAVLPVVQAHLDREQAECRAAQDPISAGIISQAQREIDALRAVEARVRALCDEDWHRAMPGYVLVKHLRATLDGDTPGGQT